MEQLVAAGTQFMREVNAAAILRRLRAESSMSVSALAKAVGLSRQAVTRSLNALTDEGLVEFGSLDRDSSRAGRPAQLVRFRAEAGHVLGVSISPQDLRVAVADLCGTVIAADAVQFGARPGAEQVLGTLLTTVASVLRAAGPTTLWYASIGTPGIVDPAAGIIKLLPTMPGLTGDVLLRRLKETLGCPIYLDNDVKLATQGERWRDAEQREDSLVMLHWGERVGAGIVLNGELYRGTSNDAGDVGFLDLFTERTAPVESRHPHGLGPFEDRVGGEEIVRQAAAAAGRAGDAEFLSRIEAAGERAFETVLDAVVAGTPAALEAIDVVARRFAKGIAVIRALLDPRLVVIGGPMARCGETLLAALRRHLEDELLDQPLLEISTLQEDAVVHGALLHSLDEVERTRFGLVRTGRHEGR
ncbi:Sugar kinase of the NBD/HSP70 family, may contain an N-terminal HTH domain [Nonomuraea solani]|uniref:Sugar kinase of the NBD/HSP70 family, may contain an N-terminal HTH domain n=1 Tax=Nonomuraea solani TaxID=1144553 RepID=A0A1H6DCK3_9ACTN|nr:ROK family transcriptional regulator [Nonomuraea solani]SEG83010.1 Sugar kinase of the NBD/HSP70 family, may contain an N-terminal HTH domain [Nonomuraea solani]